MTLSLPISPVIPAQAGIQLVLFEMQFGLSPLREGLFLYTGFRPAPE
jgi:hypothetical protein